MTAEELVEEIRKRYRTSQYLPGDIAFLLNLVTELIGRDAADAEAGVRRCWWDEECQEWAPVGEPPS